MIKILLILFFLQMRTEIVNTILKITTIFNNHTIQMMVWPLMNISYLIIIANTIMHAAMI